MNNIDKNKEPAQSANCTSSEKNLPNYDDTSCCRICQEQLLKKLKAIEHTLSPEVFEDVELLNIALLSGIIGEAHGMIRMLIIHMLEVGDSNENSCSM